MHQTPLHRRRTNALRNTVAVALLASGIPLVTALAFGALPASAAAPAVTCTPAGSTLTIAITSGTSTTAASGIQIGATGGNYVITVNGVVGPTGCTGTYSQATDTTVSVTNPAAASQYVVVDDSSGNLASSSAGCKSSFTINLGALSGSTVETIADTSSPAPGDDVTAAEAILTAGNTTDSAYLAYGSGCTTANVTVGPAAEANIPLLDVVGAGAAGDEIDLLGTNSVLPNLVINMNADTIASPAVIGNPFPTNGEGGPIDFSGQTEVVTPAVGTTIKPGTATGIEFLGEPNQVNTFDLSGETAPATGLTVDENLAPGTLTGTSSAGTPISDTFGDMIVFNGSPTGTSFILSGEGGEVVEGNGASGNTINLSAAPGTAKVTANANTLATPGVVSGLTVGFASLTTDTFSDIQSLTGSLAPSEPTSVVATATGGGGSVAFSAPLFNFGSAPSNYTVTAADSTNSGHGGQTASGATSPIVVGGLTAGDSYTFTVKATNANGQGPASAASNAIVPVAAQTISFTSHNPLQVRVGSSPYVPAATATSSLAVALTLDAGSTGCTLSDSDVSFTSVGTCLIDANQPGNGTYGPATQVQQSITVLRSATQINITSTPPSKIVVNGAAYRPQATSTSHDAVTISLGPNSNGCTLTNGVVAFVAGGTCVVDFNDAGNSNFLPAVKHQDLGVAKASPHVSVSASPKSAAHSTSITLRATITSAAQGVVVFHTGSATLCSGTIHGGVATCKIAPALGKGTYTVVGTYQGSASYNKATGSVTIKIT